MSDWINIGKGRWVNLKHIDFARIENLGSGNFTPRFWCALFTDEKNPESYNYYPYFDSEEEAQKFLDELMKRRNKE